MSILSNAPNYLLSSLSASDAALLQPHLKPVTLPAATILYKPGDAINRIYFPSAGIVSFVVGVANGTMVEAGVIGRNGAIGIGAALDGNIAINESIIQVTLTGTMIEADLLKTLAGDSRSLRVACARHEEMILGQVQQVAACNAVHSIEQRLARWLLQARDLLSGDLIMLTQESLSQMLGVNRTSVTLVARRLQQSGLIDYHRGHIRLLDADALKDVSCDCYQTINALYFRLVGWSPRAN